jgi:hypothetical protein
MCIAILQTILQTIMQTILQTDHPAEDLVLPFPCLTPTPIRQAAVGFLPPLF